MASRESWSKTLKCPRCGLEGVAWLSHVEDATQPFETKTVVDERPVGFDVREDEDDSNIFRFFCAAHDLAADE